MRVCVCVCVCVRERERKRERESMRMWPRPEIESAFKDARTHTRNRPETVVILSATGALGSITLCSCHNSPMTFPNLFFSFFFFFFGMIFIQSINEHQNTKRVK